MGTGPADGPLAFFCPFPFPFHVLNWLSVSGGEELLHDLEDKSHVLTMKSRKTSGVWVPQPPSTPALGCLLHLFPGELKLMLSAQAKIS